MGSTAAAAAFLAYVTTRDDFFDATALRGVADVRADAAAARLTCAFPVTQRVVNRNGTLHGGCIATLVDVVGTAALLIRSARGGVSLSINTTYLAPLPLGATALVDARVLRLGRTVAVIEVDIRDAATGELAATGTHVKFISPGEPDLAAIAARARPDLKAPPPPAPLPPPRAKL
jgi:acyl-coenzyme A thioesterase 13